MKILLVAVACAFCSFLVASQEDGNRTCYWYGLRSGSVQGKLYVTGGQRVDAPWDGHSLDFQEFTTLLSTDTQTKLLRMNYSKPFDLRHGPPSLDMLFDTIPLHMSTQDTPPDVDGAMLTSDLELYNFGGFAIGKSLKNTTLNYQVHQQEEQTLFDEGPQTLYSIPSNSGVSKAIALGSTASVPVKNQRQAFYFSGMHTLNSDPLLYGLMSEELVPAKSLIMADFSTLGNASWTNLTLPAEVLPRARSQIVWVPVGSQGLLVALGGVPYPPDLFTNFTSEQQDANKQAGSSFMSTVSIFDIATKQWYQQNTTGEIPDQLEGFCAVLAHKADVSQTTFEIFVYGGTNGLERPGGAIPATDNVYVLSMPAFRWFNVHSGNESHARTRHACAMPSPNQMLVVGGWPGTGKCFEDWSTLDVFDLNTLEWLRKFDPHASKPYKTADVLTQQLTNKPGVLTPAVSTLFDTPYSKTISNFYPTAKPRSKSKRLGAIVGGSVAGTVLAALVVLSIWCFRRSMRWSSADRESSITTSSGGPIMRWLRGTQSTMPPKSVMSDATTEVEPAVIFSKAPAELDSRARAESMATGPQAELEEARLNTALHPSRAYSSTRPRRSRSRSPSSQQTVSVEAAGAPLHEVHGESKNLSIPPTMVSSERDGTGLAYLTDHHLYPWDINWTQTEPQADEKAAVADDDKASLQRSPSAVTMPSPVDKRARSTKVADLPQAPNEAAITEMGVEPDQHRQDAAAVEPAPDHAPETRTSTAATPQMSKRDSAVSPLLQQQDISRTRDRTQFSSISSSVSAMDDLPASVVDTTLQSRGPARVDSLAQVIRKRTNGDHESEILNRADTVGDGDRD